MRFLICHYHWIDYQRVPIAVERRHMRPAVERLTNITALVQSPVFQLIKEIRKMELARD